MTTDEKTQVKLSKNNKVILHFIFGGMVKLAALRIWNYNGHRINKNIGVKKIHLKVEGRYVFSGDILESSGSSENAHKFC